MQSNMAFFLKLKLVLVCLFLQLSLSGQLYKAGLLMPINDADWQCCIHIPLSGFTLYASPDSRDIWGCINLEKYETEQRDYNQVVLIQNKESQVLTEWKLFRSSYEMRSLEYWEEKNGFYRVFDGYWIAKEELDKKKYTALNWKDFLEKYNRNTLGYYANDPGLNIRKGPGIENDKIMTLRGDEMEISLTQEYQGLWAKVEVTHYKVHPCSQSEPGDDEILKKFKGWIKLLDDDGTPNVHYYPSGC